MSAADPPRAGVNWWRAAAGPRRPELTGTRRCRTAIVGGGLAGVSVALHLLAADPGHDVVLLEADRIAAGASGRGTGLVGPRVGPSLRTARRRFGDDLARAAYLDSVRAVSRVGELVARYGVDCAYRPGSQLLVADSAAAERLAAEARAAWALGLDVTPVADPPGAYRLGIRYTPAATVDPAALTRGLAAVCEGLGLTVFERSPVRAVGTGARIALETPAGALRADRVVFALNAFGGLGGSGGVLGVRVQAGATAPLPEAARAELAGLRDRPILEYGSSAPYFRLTADDRLVVGGGPVRRGVRGRDALDRAWFAPALRRIGVRDSAIAVTDVWSGPIAMTRSGWPVVGSPDDDRSVFVLGGWNGHGLAAAVAGGARIARMISGDAAPGPVLPWHRGRAEPMPQHAVAQRVLDRYLAVTSWRAARRIRDRRDSDGGFGAGRT
ncbi:NAD(P)/FAD-dependent oxidoreductase [Nocardia sp. NPDC003482]